VNGACALAFGAPEAEGDGTAGAVADLLGEEVCTWVVLKEKSAKTLAGMKLL
jgi:hypothetical protein